MKIQKIRTVLKPSGHHTFIKISNGDSTRVKISVISAGKKAGLIMGNRQKITKAVEACGWKIKLLEFDRNGPDEGSNWVIVVEAGRTPAVDEPTWAYTPFTEDLEDFFDDLQEDYQFVINNSEATNEN